MGLRFLHQLPSQRTDLHKKRAKFRLITREVLDLVEKYRNSGRKVNKELFHITQIGEISDAKILSILDTVRANRKTVPLCFLMNRKTRPYIQFRSLYQSWFATQGENVSMLSYVGKVDKYVLVLSIQQLYCYILLTLS